MNNLKFPQFSVFYQETLTIMKTEAKRIHLAFQKTFFSENFTLTCTHGEQESMESIRERHGKKEFYEDEELVSDEENPGQKKYIRQHWGKLKTFISLLDGERKFLMNKYYFEKVVNVQCELMQFSKFDSEFFP